MSDNLTKYQVLSKYFLDSFPLEMMLGAQKPANWKAERAKFYFEKIGELNSAVERIRRYEIYFVEFYPDSKTISVAEAIEYHWHSYIQDFYILEDRIIKIIGSLKNDLRRYDIGNPAVAKQLLDHLKTQVTNGFGEAHDFRRKHVHETTARNFDLSRAKLLAMVQIHQKDWDPTKVATKITEFTEKSKDEFIEMARRNAKVMTTLEDFFAPRFGHLFASLNGHDYSMFKMD